MFFYVININNNIRLKNKSNPMIMYYERSYMKKNSVWYILIISLLLLLMYIFNLLNINYIYQEKSEIVVIRRKSSHSKE